MPTDRPHLLLTSLATVEGPSGRTLRRAGSEGRLTRLRRGVFADPVDVQRLDRAERHLLDMRAVAATRFIDPVFSHRSAAVVYGLPLLGGWRGVDVVAAGRVGNRSKNGVRWHLDAIDDDEITLVDGLHVTTLARTLADLARSDPFLSAVMALDAGTRVTITTPSGTRIAGASKEELLAIVEASVSRRGVRAARAAIAFADPRSDSPGESLSRGQFHIAGFPPPRLQVEFPRADGSGVDIVDFDWPEYLAFGEFDGYGKYVREEYTGGRPIERVVFEEKRREDRIRLHRPRAARWGWTEAMDRPALVATLRAAGLPQVRRPLDRA